MFYVLDDRHDLQVTSSFQDSHVYMKVMHFGRLEQNNAVTVGALITESVAPPVPYVLCYIIFTKWSHIESFISPLPTLPRLYSPGYLQI